MRYLATSLLMLGLQATLAQAGESVSGNWLAVSNGEIPATVSPVAVGQFPDGRGVYVCRGQAKMEPVAVGRLVQGSGYCVVVDGKRPVALANFDVLVASSAFRPAAAAAAAVAVEPRVLRPPAAIMQRQKMERAKVIGGLAAVPGGLPADCSALATHRSEAAQSSVARYGSVDSESGAYVEEHYGDGYTLYHFKDGIVVVSPSNARAFCSLMAVRMEVQYGSPPPLPSDPKSGAGWVEHHNEQLLMIISKQVAFDKPTMNAIAADESATTGGDLFKQTDYLTGIADFYATQGK